MLYNIDEPIDAIFHTVDDLIEIAELATRPFTIQQMVDLAYMIIAKLPSSA